MIDSYSFWFILAAEGDIVSGLSGLAAQGLTLWLIIFAVSFMVQSAKGGLGALTGKMRRSSEGLAGKARQWGDQEAKFIDAKQRGRLSAKGMRAERSGRFAKYGIGKKVRDEEGNVKMVEDYKRRGALVRYTARRERERKGVESEAEYIKAGMLADAVVSDKDYQKRVAGASMYGVESQREAAIGRARARASGDYSKFLGESKDAYKSEIRDEAMSLGQITQLASLPSGQTVTINGKTFDEQYRLAALDTLADMGQVDNLVEALKVELPQSIRGSVLYSLRDHYTKFQEKGHILNNNAVLENLASTGKIDTSLLDAAVKDMAGRSVLEFATQKGGVLKRMETVLDMTPAERQQIGISDDIADQIRAQARQVFQSQAAQAQLSGEARASLHRIAQLPTDIGPPGSPPPSVTQPPGSQAA